MGFEETLTLWLTTMSHHPGYLYAAVILLLTASSFGLPMPEEIVLLTSGMIANVSMAEAARTGTPASVDPTTIALVCFAAVLLSDFLVYFLGRRLGPSALRFGVMKRVFTSERMSRLESWTTQYGSWACGAFRFTPGLRFPGHFMCGAMRVSYLKFLTVDGLAALVSVPTQVLLLAYFGDEVLAYIKQFKIVVLIAAAIAIAVWLLSKIKKEQPEGDVATWSRDKSA